MKIPKTLYFQGVLRISCSRPGLLADVTVMAMMARIKGLSTTRQNFHDVVRRGGLPGTSTVVR
jgi:hypothetical protein